MYQRNEKVLMAAHQCHQCHRLQKRSVTQHIADAKARIAEIMKERNPQGHQAPYRPLQTKVLQTVSPLQKPKSLPKGQFSNKIYKQCS